MDECEEQLSPAKKPISGIGGRPPMAPSTAIVSGNAARPDNPSSNRRRPQK